MENQETQRQLSSIEDIYKGSYDAFYDSGTRTRKILGTIDDENEDIIAVFFKPIGIQNILEAYHLYILIHDHRENKQIIIRGGPSFDVGVEYAIVYFLVGATPEPAPGVKSFGYIRGDVNLNRPLELIPDMNNPTKNTLIGSVDFDITGTHLGVIVKKGGDLRDIFKSFASSVKLINDLYIRYNPRYPNSNSFVTTLLQRAGLPTTKDVIDSYPASAENKSFFTNLFTPGAAVIDITRPDVVYDTPREARELQNIIGQLARKNDSAKVNSQLAQDDKITTIWPNNQVFFNQDESNLVNKVNKEIKEAGVGNVFVADVNLA